MHTNDRRRRLRSLPELWFSEPPLKHVFLSMHLRDQHQQTLTLGPELTASLSDELLLRVLSNVPESSRPAASLVCKRWFSLLGRLHRRLTLPDWSSLSRLPLRFPDLADIDLLRASFCVSSPSPLLLTRGPVSIRLDPYLTSQIGDSPFVSSASLDSGLETLALNYPNLRRLSLVAPLDSEAGVMAVADRCGILQELELHRCTDVALGPISAFQNLQILKLVGSVEGLYRGPGVSDVGLTIVAHGCKRLVKLELAGCEGSYDGISAIGRCCFMLEELTIANHRMDDGWLAGLSFCGNLKTLRMLGCRRIDGDPGPEEHLGSCLAIERVQLQRCQVRDKRSLMALFMVCEAAREVMFHDCWGLDNDMFGIVSLCRRVKFLSLEGCSLLTTDGLESVVLSWSEIQSLIVISCNNIKDEEVTPALSSLFPVLKELKWRPDSKSVFSENLAGTGIWKKGGRFFKRT